MENIDREDQHLVLTPAKLRLDSRVVATYATGTWLMHSVFILLLVLRVSALGLCGRSKAALTSRRCC